MKEENSKKVDEILTRGVDEVIGVEDLKKDLISGKTLRIKLGVDPTSPNIHLGRATQFLKLRDFQELGHKIIFIIGDFTGVIGDTSDKESERPMLTSKEVKQNMKNYFKQVGKILNMRKVEKKYNSKWLKKLTYQDITEQADQFSVADFIARENIKKRLDSGKRVSLREVLYPLMQGYDSVVVKADMELGGTDQRFNILAGRKLQEHFRQKPQGIIMLDLIEGLDGRKMSSSWGNTINVADEPNDMYGKVMSLKDDLMVKYFVSSTRISMDEVREIENGLKNNSLNPRDIKMRLAKEITTIYHGEKEAIKAEENFIQTFQKRGTPEDIEIIKVDRGSPLVDVLLKNKIISSKNDFRRLVKEGAIKNTDNGEKITDPDFKISENSTFKIGKKRFLKIVVK